MKPELSAGRSRESRSLPRPGSRQGARGLARWEQGTSPDSFWEMEDGEMSAM